MPQTATDFSAISRKQKFCPTSRLSPSITLVNIDMELGKGSTERITIYKGEYCSSEERLHYENPPLWTKNRFGREIGWLIHRQISSSPDCRRNRRKWELRMCLVWREKQLTSEIRGANRYQIRIFYRTQVNLGSDLWVRMSLRHKLRHLFET